MPASHAVPARRHHERVEGAGALARELAAARKLMTLKHSTDRDELPRCEAMLVYLTGETWASAAFADEVEEAMQSGKRLLLAHEMPGLGQEARHAVELGPRHL